MKFPKFPKSRRDSDVVKLGDNQVVLGRFAQSGETIVLEHFGCEQVLATEPSESAESDAAIRAAALVARRSGTRGGLSLVVPGHLALTKFVEAPALPRAKLRKVLQFEAGQQIPYPLSEVVWDHGVIAERESRLDIVLAAAKREAMQALCDGVEAEGFQLRHAVPGSVALAHAFRHNYPDAAGAALVIEIGARSTLLLFIDAKRFLVRTLMLASDGISNAPQEPHDDFTRRLLQEVSRSLVSLRRGANPMEPSQVLVAGESRQVETLAPLLEGHCKCPVERFDALRRVAVSSAAEAAGARRQVSQLASLVGLGVIAANEFRNVPNLIGARWPRAIVSRRRFTWLSAAAALAGLAMLTAIWHLRALAKSEQEEIHKLDTALGVLRDFAATNAEHLVAIERLGREVARSESLARSRTSWTRFFADLQARLTAVEDVWLEKLVVVEGSERDRAGEAQDRREPRSLRLAVSGRMLKRVDEAGARSSPHGKVKQLLASLRESAFVGAIEGERFDDAEPELLRFDFIIVSNADARL